MIKWITLYHRPEDPAAFERYYREVHLPIVRQIPGWTDLRVYRDARATRGDHPAIYLVDEVVFSSRADLERALYSEAAKLGTRDMQNFARAGFTTLIVEETQV